MSPPEAYPRLTHLGDITIERFLADYWQKKPLLIRQCFPGFQSPVSADELAGLALDEDVNSRLVIEHREASRSNWEVVHGPLEASRFGKLPDSHWTLLVQHVDTLNPQVSRLLNAFRFIPNWRLDDIMVSYAADQGSVGPHFDYYDVFLLQAQGKRRWRIGQTCSAQTALVPDQPMKILADFEQSEEWLLEPGDMLYLPPMLAHWGIAEGECMTYSVGFRAPSHADILLDFAQETASQLTEDLRYADPDLAPQLNTGEISSQALNRIQHILQQYMTDKTRIAQWLGETMTRPKTMDMGLFDPITQNALRGNTAFRLNPVSRSAFFDSHLFVDGNMYECSKTFCAKLTNGDALRFNNLDTVDRNVALQLAELELLIQTDD